MARDTERDDKYFNCFKENDLNYISNLYIQKVEVKVCLKEVFNTSLIKYFTYKEAFQIIKEKLGCDIPD